MIAVSPFVNCISTLRFNQIVRQDSNKIFISEDGVQSTKCTSNREENAENMQMAFLTLQCAYVCMELHVSHPHGQLQ